MVGFPAPSVHKLRPVGKDQQYFYAGDALQKVFQCIFRALIHPVQVLDRHHQRPYLRAFEDDLFHDFNQAVLLPFRAHGNLFHSAVFDR